MLLRFHINKIHDNDTGYIPQGKLKRNFLRRLHIDPKPCLFHIFSACQLSRIDIDHSQCLCGLNDKITAGLQPYLFAKRFLKPGLHTVKLVQRQPFILVKPRLRHMERRIRLPVCHNFFVDAGIIRHDFPALPLIFVPDSGKICGFCLVKNGIAGPMACHIHYFL